MPKPLPIPIWLAGVQLRKEMLFRFCCYDNDKLLIFSLYKNIGDSSYNSLIKCIISMDQHIPVCIYQVTLVELNLS